MNSDDKDIKMEESEEDENIDDNDSMVDDGNRLKYNVRIPFPTEHYATSAMNALGVDAPYQSTRNKKTTIRRKMHIEELEDGTAYLNIELSCEENKEGEIGCLRTAASGMINNLSLICETIKEFGVWFYIILLVLVLNYLTRNTLMFKTRGQPIIKISIYSIFL